MNDLLTRYQRRDREGLATALQPWLRCWALDTFREIGLQPNRDWLDESVSAASLALVSRLGRLLDQQIESDRHLLNVLRRPCKKAIRKALHRLHPIPQPIKGPKREQISLVDADRIIATRWKRCEPEPKTRYWLVVDWAVTEALQRAQGQTWLACLMVLHGAEWHKGNWRHSSMTQIAAQIGIPRRTLIDRLRKLGDEVAANASPEMCDWIEEFLRVCPPNSPQRGRA